MSGITTHIECPHCHGAGEYARPGDGLRTTKCWTCNGSGFADARKDVYAWDTLAESRGFDLSKPGQAYEASQALGFERPFGPHKFASTRCRSGRRNYCTCDTCF